MDNDLGLLDFELLNYMIWACQIGGLFIWVGLDLLFGLLAYMFMIQVCLIFYAWSIVGNFFLAKHGYMTSGELNFIEEKGMLERLIKGIKP